MNKLKFKGKTIYSSKFEDIYYNPLYGLEESVYVFIKGCDLDKELLKLQSTTIAELGFGSGLNLIALLKHVKENNIKTKINYYSIEKFPLTKKQIKKISQFFSKDMPYFKTLLKKYPNIPKKNIKFKITDSINLKILIGDVGKKLKEVPKYIDYWFLDGFSPRKNFKMWNKEIFSIISQKSKIGTKLSTFSAARIVKDGLKLANFNYSIIKGFNNKRHMIKAQKE
ncbi:tRNA (5-methylaminomethyl-2-thiouridine)(34)-methyltransferase MnmD [Borrelia miyamotoi]|uniref:tRNA (5-methylaminomethyl-2-thiouridine)(34)-methyltransferase MnmD n=1 Tax=Borrelia miyamotoi TaxID=47466 RepID=A0AAX3JKV3_9SPIR|nr:tRNA (5-methylaminomethyl-2-thiouridine)(34)-methyltransferase MnmD [Borrelia miyamotoi]QFP41637.1 tRNA (5-methylaminomethyl-2-thiouridine)(34)-methyltransferase MnmD [Borrelia miyamotoi]QFP47757.1 tRNA (5-methylaminomethyl-2-thiouridine)(34)-methyltransferase MnmD [Borrelia miyamotoi]QGT55517.1 tRNA (5-methylaminomethyl-2-thiouridine)(34)-methyltransferase MnmD [Borrelia miyamotoi]QGT56299.1 tRNA (5-methylaminomethyl-2-thiouridine)(34)-methyltransferase MnmD [Borrelia miyamotoi]WAZ71547.1 